MLFYLEMYERNKMMMMMKMRISTIKEVKNRALHRPVKWKTAHIGPATHDCEIILYPTKQWRIQGAGGRWPPPLAAWKNFFCQYINIITKPTAYDGPWEY